jgi:hypothetical protein
MTGARKTKSSLTVVPAGCSHPEKDTAKLTQVIDYNHHYYMFNR